MDRTSGYPFTFDVALACLAFILCGARVVFSVLTLVEYSINYEPTDYENSVINVVECCWIGLSVVSLWYLWCKRDPENPHDGAFGNPRHFPAGRARPAGNGQGILNDDEDQAADAPECDELEHSFLNVDVCGYSLIPVLFIVLAVSGLVTPVYKAVATAACFTKKSAVYDISTFVDNVLISVFLSFQTLFIICAKRQKCTTKVEAFALWAIIISNMCLCVRCLADGATQAFVNKKHNGTREAFTSVFCYNQTDVMTSAFIVIDKHVYVPFFILCLCSFEFMCGMLNLHRRPIGMPERGETFDTDAEHVALTESVPLLSWNNVQRAEESRNTTRDKLLQYFTLVWQHSYVPALIICLSMLATHVYLDYDMGDFQVERNGTSLEEDTAFMWVQFVFLNFICGAAFIGFMLVRFCKVSSQRLHLKHIMLPLGACFHLALLGLETVDAVWNITQHQDAADIIVFLIKTGFHYIGLLAEVLFLLKALDTNILKSKAHKLVYVRGMLYFLAVCYLERCIVDSFLTPAIVRHASHVHDNFFGRPTWEVITRVLTPGVAYYRLKSGLLSFEVLEKL